MMSLPLIAEPLPLKADADGVIRIGTTRVTLDTIVQAFRRGASAETIAEQYPSLALSEIYTTIGFFLRRPDETDTYLNSRRERADRVRQENELRWPRDGIRERLMARSRSYAKGVAYLSPGSHASGAPWVRRRAGT